MIYINIKNVFAEAELNREATVKYFLTVQNEGARKISRELEHYNLDIIISVGYRIKSSIATAFRQWATTRLREYIIKGFVIDDERLKNPDLPFDYFEELTRRIADIRTSDVYAGSIGIFDINKESKTAEIGYWLSAKFVRKGYATEAVKIMEKEFFTNKNLNRIQIRCDEKNIASSGVAKKCGYIFEGKHREDSYNNYFKGFRNTLVFSKLKSDYKKEKIKKLNNNQVA